MLPAPFLQYENTTYPLWPFLNIPALLCQVGLALHKLRQAQGSRCMHVCFVNGKPAYATQLC